MTTTTQPRATTRRRFDIRLELFALGFLLLIVAANWATSTWGPVPVFWGLSATAGTYFAGLTFVARDEVQERGGWSRVAALIAGGAVLSYLVADPFIALASVVAFAFAEVADALVFTPLREAGWTRARVLSNIAGAVVDTFLFLWVAGFAITSSSVTGQLVGKLLLGTVIVLLVGWARARRARP